MLKAQALERVREVACWMQIRCKSWLWTGTVMRHNVTSLVWMMSRLWRFTGTTSVITEQLYSVFIAQASLSLDSASTSEDDDDDRSGPDLQTQQAHVALLPSDKCDTFIGGKWSSTSMTALLHFHFHIVFHRDYYAVYGGNWYYHWCVDSVDEGCSPQPDITEAEMFVFLAITVQMGLHLWDQLTGYWAKSGPVLHSILQQHDETKQMFTHPLVSAFLGRQVMKLTRRKKIMTTETMRFIWSSKLNIFKIVQPFRKFGSWQSYSFVQVKGNFQTVCCQEAQKFWLSGCTNYVTSLATPKTCKCTWGRVDIAWGNSWQQPMPLWQDWWGK
jgi:hypothetical protein